LLKRYEAMFLFDTAATRDWAAIEEEVRRLCSRLGAELLVCVKFDERKLAYEITRRKRGTYVLAYLDAPSDRIGDLERDIQLSEVILRGLVLRTDRLTEERLAELRAHPAETPIAPPASDGRRHDDDRHGHDRRPRDFRRTPDAPPETRVAEVAAPVGEATAQRD
jgi:small subunit ribosomal protein S6